MTTSHLYVAMLEGQGSPPSPDHKHWMGFAVVGALFLAALTSLYDGGPDRSEWSELPCLSSHREEYRRQDERQHAQHAQGGRGGLVTAYRTVCDERATIGPVMPRGWTRGKDPVRPG